VNGGRFGTNGHFGVYPVFAHGAAAIGVYFENGNFYDTVRANTKAGGFQIDKGKRAMEV